MTIYLPKKLSPTGGTSSFARKLQHGLQEHGHRVVFTRPPAYDLLLVSPRASLQDLAHAWWHKKPIIHRLDGVYYPQTKAGWLFPLYNLPLSVINFLFSRWTIFQSSYSQNICHVFLGTNRRKRRTIIYNGVDINHFTPAKESRSPQKPHFVTTGRFRHPDQIIPLITIFRSYRKRHAGATFTVIGSFEGLVTDVPTRFTGEPGLSFDGVVENQALPSRLRAADVFLISHLNPPCPNNVIEALACGLPICGVADGAMPEIVQSGVSGELTAVQSGGYFKRRTFNYQDFSSRLERMVNNQPQYAAAARNDAVSRFSLSQMCDGYLGVFRRWVPNQI